MKLFVWKLWGSWGRLSFIGVLFVTGVLVFSDHPFVDLAVTGKPIAAAHAETSRVAGTILKHARAKNLYGIEMLGELIPILADELLVALYLFVFGHDVGFNRFKTSSRQ
jgi:hypothetical protein